MSHPLRFELVRVIRMPGFAHAGFELADLSPGINVVHGPNGSGKTTSARAIEALLWHRDAAALRPHLAGRFSLGSDEWSVEVEHDRASHQRNGIVADAPVLPPAEDRDRYRLSLHGLLRTEASNARLAQAILREAAGGYDVEAARAKLPAASPLTTRSKEVGSIRKAVADLEAAIGKQSSLYEQEVRLGELERRRKDAADAARRAELLRHAIDFARAREDHGAARERVLAFASELVSMRGDEAEQLAATMDDLRAVEEEIADARKKMTAAAAAIEHADLDPSVDAAFLAGVRQDLETVRQLERTLEDCERARDGAAGHVEEARRPLGPMADDGRLAGITLDELGDLSGEAGRVESARQRVSALQARLAVLSVDDERDTGPELDRLSRAEEALAAWLRAPAPGASTGGRARTAAIAAGGMLILLGAALATAEVAALLISVAGAVAIWLAAGRGNGTFDERSRAREELERAGVEPPEAWDADAVRRRLDQLQERKTVLRDLELRRRERAGYAAELVHAERALEAAEGAGREIAERLGLSPDTDIVRLAWLVDRLGHWSGARAELADAEAARRRAAEHLDAARTALHQLLAPYADVTGGDRCDSGALAAAIHRLESRREARDGGIRDRDAAAELMPGLESRRRRSVEAARAIYRACGVSEGDAPALHERCREYPAYREARAALDQAEVALRLARGRLEAVGGDESLLAAQIGDLERERADAEREASELQAISDEAVRIRDRIESAKTLHDIEGCLERLEREKDGLRDARERETRGVVADRLARSVRAATESEHLPGVFHRADELLSRITHGRYGLRFTSTPEPGFLAYDNQERQGRALEELSSGTRLQLLLAIRVAFVETQEREAKLPLVLDEVLGNSDDARAAAIMDAVLELARDGRQIFYLTAQHDEVAKWKAALEAQDEVKWRLVEMPDRRGGQRPLRIENLRVAPAPGSRIPSPAGSSHAEYAGKLGVPAIDPVSAHAGNLHLWYLIDDPGRLHDVLRAGVGHWGELQALARHAGDAVIDAELLARTAALARAADAWLESSRIGAGRPVDRQALVEADCVSNAFLDRVDEKRLEVGGDARRLLSALEEGEVKGFRKDNIARLRERLEERGWLDTRERLPDSEIRSRVIGRISPEIGSGIVTLRDVDGLIARLAAGTASPAEGPVPGD